jgi:hypothetical protein
VNAPKCQFNRKTVKFFGFTFGKDGVSPDPDKIADIANMQTPKSVSEIRSFLGMAQYSAHFIPGFATITEPLCRLTKKEVALDQCARSCIQVHQEQSP